MSHDRNCDILQLVDRLAASADLVQTFRRYPSWNRGHRRTSYTGKEGVDHVNPAFFRADLIVDHVVLDAVWRSGRAKAERVLDEHGIKFDLRSALTEPGVDFLQPHGGDKYPGVATDHDRSIIDDDEAVVADDDDGDGGLDIEKGCTDNAGGVELDDLLDEPDISGQVSTSEDMDGDWLLCTLPNGQKRLIHKASILSILFQSGFDKLAIDRLLRVRCYTRDFRKPDPNGADICGDNIFTIGDIVTCLIRTVNQVGAALVSVVGIERKGKSVPRINLDELEDKSMQVQLTGQVLIMKESFMVTSKPSSSTGSESAESGGDDDEDIPVMARKWIWTGQYTRFSPLLNGGNQSSAEHGTRKSHIVRVPGHLAQPLAAYLERATPSLPPDNLDDMASTSTHTARRNWLPTTWSICHEQLSVLVESAFGPLDPTEYLEKLTKYGSCNAFPYQDKNHIPQFILHNASRILGEKRGDTSKTACYLCGDSLKADMHRGHVGQHVFLALNGIVEEKLHAEIIVESACGFCGRSTCTVSMKKTAKTVSIKTGCSREHPFSYKAALTPSTRTPSTNVPIHCTLCAEDPITKLRPVLWKYAMYNHIQVTHPRNWDSDAGHPQNLDRDLQNLLTVTQQEFSLIMKTRIPNPTLPLSISFPYIPCATAPAAPAIRSKRAARTIAGPSLVTPRPKRARRQ